MGPAMPRLPFAVRLPGGVLLVALVIALPWASPAQSPPPAVPGANPGPAPPCGPAQTCPAEHFCGRNRRCVSAVLSVVAGAGHSCAVHRNGRVSCWGYSDAVKGIGRAVSGPVEIAGIDHPRALSAGHHQTCAVTADRQVRCFGLDDRVIGSDDGRPLGDVDAVALGAGFGCALGKPGIHCWGRNEYGQLARPLDTSGSPNAVLAQPGPRRFLGAGLAVLTHDSDGRAGGGQTCGWGNNATRLITRDDTQGAITTPTCLGMDDVADLTVGAAHACVRHRRGSFACWGERYYGQLGTGGDDKADVAAPGTRVTLPAPVLQLAAGAGHTCALVRGGRVYCFGLNSAGQVGTGPDQVLRPRMRTGLHGPAVAIGSGSSARHTCAVLADGGVECWGNDDAGQLGAAPASLQEGRFSRTPVRVAF